MMLASCAKERAEQDSVRNESHQEIQGTVVTIQAALGSQEAQAAQGSAQQSAATKTTQTGGSYSWSDGETISVGTSEGAYTTFTLSNAATGTFTHTFEGDVPDLQMAVSPVQSGSYTGTTNFTVSLPTVYDGYVSGTTNALLIGTPDPETENKFLFHHAAALIKVTYNNVPYGTTGLVLTANENIASTSGITLGSTDDVIESDNAALNSSSVWINLASAVSEPNQSLVFYVPVPVGDYTGLNIYLVNSSGKIDRSEKTSTKTFTLERKTIFATPGIPVDLTIDPVTVGKTDNTSTFGNDNGQVYTIPAGKRLNLIFENYSSGAQVWNNWVFYNVYGSTGHFVRADSYDRIDNGTERVGSFTTGGSYSTSMLNGATVTATIDYYASGSYVLNVSAVKGNTTGTLKYTYTMTANLASITTPLRSDGSHYVMKDAWLEDAPAYVVRSEAAVYAYMVGNANNVMLSPHDGAVADVYSDGSRVINTKYYDSGRNFNSTTPWSGYPVYNYTGAGSEQSYSNALSYIQFTDASTNIYYQQFNNCALVINKSEQATETGTVGKTDYSSTYNANPDLMDHSKTWTVPVGTSLTVALNLHSDNLQNYHSPDVVLRRTGTTTNIAITRMDDWLNSGSATKHNNWNWDTFKANLNGSKVYITVTNGNKYASIRYYVIYPDGTTKRYQTYDDIAITPGEAIDFMLIAEGCYFTFD